MPDALNYAKYFIYKKLDTYSNTFDGNMKIQKLLVFANVISLAIRGIPLFDDTILAFRQGCVIENVRLRYKNDYAGLTRESENFSLEFTQEEFEVLNICISIFGNLTARELSNLNHSFNFWKEAYEYSIQPGGYHDKNKAVVSVESINTDLDRIREIIEVFKKTQAETRAKEVINGIEFLYNPKEIIVTDDIIDELFVFSMDAEDLVYTVYTDNGTLVIC